MTARVIQGSFVGGGPRIPSPVAQPTAMPRPPEPLVRPFARHPPVAQSKSVPRPPGPPTPAFAEHAPGAVQRHGAGGAFAVEAGPLGLASSGGRPLPEAVCGKMEAALDADFSGVRVHVGPQAERIGAIAFTLGSDIYFAPGRYQPDTVHGQQLLGHELAHVVQQRAGRVRNPLGSGIAVVQDHALEAEADRLGRHAAAHRVAAQPKMPPGAMQASTPVRISAPISAGPGSYRLTAGTGGRQVGSVMVHARDKGVVEVTDLGVDQGQRGRGIGQMLVASAAKTGLQFGNSKVTLAAQDRGSGRLTQWYKGIGFTQIGVNQRGFPQLEAPIGRVLAGTAQRQLKQGAPSGPRATSGSTRGRSHPGPRSPDSRAGFMRIKAPGRAVQRMERVNNPRL
jgi:ribosomal protein S18 acetylase RimI-like enzyme